MALKNGMQWSETLNNAIFEGGTPSEYTLRKQIDAMLAQYSPKITQNQEAQEVLGRIESLSQAVAFREEGTRTDLVKLYMETITKNRLWKYAQQAAVLESHQRNRVASILGDTSNDETYPQAA